MMTKKMIYRFNTNRGAKTNSIGARVYIETVILVKKNWCGNNKPRNGMKKMSGSMKDRVAIGKMRLMT